jgi:uncharacterized protein YdhG (YjbR/CyaY superfamily)
MTDGKSGGLSAAEQAAVKARAAELRGEKKNASVAAKREQALQGVLDAIAALSGTDRELAEKFHQIVTEVAPDLEPKTWYGMPAYAKDGKALCFFKASAKFGARYATFGFNDVAALDDGRLWPTDYAILEFTPAVEKAVRALVAKAVG